MEISEAILWILAQDFGMVQVSNFPDKPKVYNIEATKYGKRFGFSCQESDLLRGIADMQYMMSELPTP